MGKKTLFLAKYCSFPEFWAAKHMSGSIQCLTNKTLKMKKIGLSRSITNNLFMQEMDSFEFQAALDIQ